MAGYLARRLLLLVPTFVGLTLLVFAVTRFVPGGPIDQVLLEMAGDGRASRLDVPPAVLAALEAQFGLDRPWPIAYLRWLGGALTGDLGVSYKYNVPVTELIADRLPVTLYFGGIGFVLSYLVCVPLGVAKAVRHGTPFDLGTSALVFAGYSLPGWAVGSLLLLGLGGGWFPLGGLRSPGWEELSWVGKVWDQLRHTILPVTAYAVTSFAALTVLVKNSMLDVLGQDYVRTAYAKGLDERRVWFGHALQNALVPVCTGLGRSIGALAAGSYLVERVFNIDGLGYLGYTSLVDRDYTVVMGILAVHTALGLAGHLVSDVLYGLADPRIRLDA